MDQRVAKTISLMGLFLMIPVAAVVWADASGSSTDSSSAATRVDYGTGAGEKLGRGLGNIAFGWLEIPKGIEDVGDQRNFIAGITWGPLQGIGKAVVRTLAGVYDTATFPIPHPQNFEPLVRPEFVLEDKR